MGLAHRGCLWLVLVSWCMVLPWAGASVCPPAVTGQPCFSCDAQQGFQVYPPSPSVWNVTGDFAVAAAFDTLAGASAIGATVKIEVVAAEPVILDYPCYDWYCRAVDDPAEAAPGSRAIPPASATAVLSSDNGTGGVLRVNVSADGITPWHAWVTVDPAPGSSMYDDDICQQLSWSFSITAANASAEDPGCFWDDSYDVSHAVYQAKCSPPCSYPSCGQPYQPVSIALLLLAAAAVSLFVFSLILRYCCGVKCRPRCCFSCSLVETSTCNEPGRSQAPIPSAPPLSLS